MVCCGRFIQMSILQFAELVTSVYRTLLGSSVNVIGVLQGNGSYNSRPEKHVKYCGHDWNETKRLRKLNPAHFLTGYPYRFSASRKLFVKAGIVVS